MAPRKAVRSPAQEIPAENEAAAGIGHNSRNAARPELRPPSDRAVAIGRDGQPIWRFHKPFAGDDKFFIPPELIPDGWAYEWKRESTLGMQDVENLVKMKHAGWTPVMAESHPGIFQPADKPGPIIRDGMMLMERPMSLHLEALDEAKRAADEPLRRSRIQHGLSAAGSSVDTNTSGARAHTFARVGRDTGIDVPRPNLPRQPID